MIMDSKENDSDVLAPTSTQSESSNVLYIRILSCLDPSKPLM